jgi:hypothetical protein
MTLGVPTEEADVARVATKGDRLGETTPTSTTGFEFHAVLHGERALPARS